MYYVAHTSYGVSVPGLGETLLGDTPQEPVGLTESFTLCTYLMILQDVL